MTVYIYGLFCPIENTVRYVGKSNKPENRFRAHLSAARRSSYEHHTSRWIRKLLSQGRRPTLVILEEVAAEVRWQDVERAYIASAADWGWKLTNSTAGGEGLDFICPEASAKYRAKLSASLKKVWATPERREEARLRVLATWADPEIVARRKASSELTRQTPETQARYVAAAKDIHSRPEVKEKVSASLKAAWADPERKEKWIAATTTPEVKAKQSAAKLASWKDPEFVAKQAAAWTDERRAKQGKWATDPDRKAKIDAARNSAEYKEKRAATIRAKWIERNKHLPPEEFARKLANNDRVSASRKAALLAAATSTPYTESS